MTEKKTKKKSKKREKEKAFLARGKRKTSVARAVVTPGSGKIRMNNILLESFNNKYIKEIIAEPLKYLGPEANSIDIAVNVYGGGVMGQAQAARTAIAKALVGYFNSNELKKKFEEIDRSLIVEDSRRVEPKKFKGPKARARYQKSYR
ncbi:MAG: 30S ribosomal protein S9 [Candidatus Bilamarchaeaceae archaeon]